MKLKIALAVVLAFAAVGFSRNPNQFQGRASDRVSRDMQRPQAQSRMPQARSWNPRQCPRCLNEGIMHRGTYPGIHPNVCRNPQCPEASRPSGIRRYEPPTWLLRERDYQPRQGIQDRFGRHHDPRRPQTQQMPRDLGYYGYRQPWQPQHFPRAYEPRAYGPRPFAPQSRATRPQAQQRQPQAQQRQRQDRTDAADQTQRAPRRQQQGAAQPQQRKELGVNELRAMLREAIAEHDYDKAQRIINRLRDIAE